MRTIEVLSIRTVLFEVWPPNGTLFAPHAREGAMRFSDLTGALPGNLFLLLLLLLLLPNFENACALFFGSYNFLKM